MATNYALANLTPDQERLLREAEDTLGGGILLAYSEADGRSGGAPTGIAYSDLTASQVECLEGLEKQLGLVVLAVRPL
jgi:hypothetical protein